MRSPYLHVIRKGPIRSSFSLGQFCPASLGLLPPSGVEPGEEIFSDPLRVPIAGRGGVPPGGDESRRGRPRSHIGSTVRFTQTPLFFLFLFFLASFPSTSSPLIVTAATATATPPLSCECAGQGILQEEGGGGGGGSVRGAPTEAPSVQCSSGRSTLLSLSLSLSSYFALSSFLEKRESGRSIPSFLLPRSAAEVSSWTTGHDGRHPRQR